MRVLSVKKITLDKPVPVYDISVPGPENFALSAGPYVHNSKDIADGVCGVVQFWMTRRSTWSNNLVLDKGLGYHFLGDTERLAAEKAGVKHDASRELILTPETKRVRQANRRNIDRKGVSRT